MALAVVATYLAAGSPARTVAVVPVHEALSGRPMPPRKVRWSVLPGVVFVVIAFALLSFASSGGAAPPNAPLLIFGLIALVPAVILLAPFCLALAAHLGRFLPIGPRLALREPNPKTTPHDMPPTGPHRERNRREPAPRLPTSDAADVIAPAVELPIISAGRRAFIQRGLASLAAQFIANAPSARLHVYAAPTSG